MLTNICRVLSDDPDDFTVFLYDIVPQKIAREDPPFVDTSKSFFSFLQVFTLTPREFFNPRIRALRFLALPPPPLTKRRATAQLRRTSSASPPPPPPQMQTANVFEASRAGYTDVLRELCRSSGAEALRQRDSAGHTAAHWAALEGHEDVLRFLMGAGAPFDAASHHPLGQKPIHWACANGWLPVIQTLLEAGVNIDSCDASGCSPLIVAAQYGQTAAAAFLMARGAALQVCDAEGDNALHWAAFRGRPDLARLLVYSGFNPHQRDAFGQNALHLAAARGNLCAVRDFVRIDGVNAEVRDVKGRTPLDLAGTRRHDDIFAFLQREKEKDRRSLWALLDLKSVVFGPPGRQRQSQLFFLLTCLLLLYPAFFVKVFPSAWAECRGLVLLFFALNLLSWITFAKCSFADPGFVPQRQPEYDLQMRRIGCRERPPDLSLLCHTCRAMKPLRAKHCRICDRCVRHMDHHCPYIYNCVGYNNRTWFFFFSYSVLAIACLSFYFLYLRLSAGIDFVLLLLMPVGLLGLSVVGLVGSCLWISVVMNLTTNELSNRKRYAYLKNSRGLFRNPFDRGWVSNVLEFFHLRPSRELSEEQIPLIL